MSPTLAGLLILAGACACAVFYWQVPAVTAHGLTFTAVAAGGSAALLIWDITDGHHWWSAATHAVLASGWLASHLKGRASLVLPPGMAVDRVEGLIVVRCPAHGVLDIHDHHAPARPSRTEARP